MFMSRKVLALGLFASLLLSGIFFSPVNTAEEDEEFYDHQPYLQYDLHIHSFSTKYLYNYTEGVDGFPGQHLVAFPGDDEFEYREMEGSIYMRREYSQQESQDFRKLVMKSFAISQLDKNYRATLQDKINATSRGEIDVIVAIEEMANITNSYDSDMTILLNQTVSLKDLITLEMIQWVRSEFDIKSTINNVPVTPLDNRINNVNDTITHYLDGNLSKAECLSYIQDEVNVDHYYEDEQVDLNNQGGPVLTVDGVQAVWNNWHFESVGPSSSLLGPISGNSEERLWIGQWMNIRFPNLTHSPAEHTLQFEWNDEDFSGKDTNFHFSVGYGEIITEVVTDTSVDYMGYNSLEDSYQEWVSFSSINGSVKPVTIKFNSGYANYANREGFTWEGAVNYASNLTYEGQNGHLATITSLEEANTVYSLLDGNSYWLGGFHNTSSPDYTEPSGGWEWITGEKFNHSLWPKDPHPMHSDNYVEPNEAGPEDCLEVWGFDKYLNDNRCHMGWMGFVVEYEMNGTNHYEAYTPQWEWDEANQTDVLTYVLAIPLTDEERNQILKDEGDPDADDDGIVDIYDDDDDNDGIADEADMDDDNDGIDDTNDRCPGTKVGDRVDEEGCSASQMLGEISDEEGLPGFSFFPALVLILALAISRRSKN